MRNQRQGKERPGFDQRGKATEQMRAGSRVEHRKRIAGNGIARLRISDDETRQAKLRIGTAMTSRA